MRYLDPTRIALPSDDESVKRFLTYHDRSVDFQIKKLKDMMWWQRKDPAGYQARLDELKAMRQQCLVKYDPVTFEPYTYAGLWPDLKQRFKWEPEPFPVPDVTPKSIPWAKVPKDPRYYQTGAVEALEAARHAGIELPTGSGKSLVIELLAKRNAVKTVVVSPASAITDQLYQNFVSHFGQRWVGKYGDGSKRVDRLFTIATAQSLVRVEPGTPVWNELSQAKQLIWDECHTTPAETFDTVNMGLLKNAYWRYYVSATQLRTDGAEMLLKGITGPIVYRKTFKELVDEHFLARPKFKVFNVAPLVQSFARDAKAETRQNLYLNPKVHQIAADIAKKMVMSGRQVVILVEEFRQFDMLKNYLTVPFEFVHGGVSDDAKQFLPQQYWKPDSEGAIARFNEGKTMLLIGTSAISTGVDLLPVDCLIYMQGGTSEIKVRQAIGRGTRYLPGRKESFFAVDFRIVGSPTLERHVDQRIDIYNDMGEVTEH